VDPPLSVPALRRGDFDLVITEEGGFEDDSDLTGLGVERLMDDVLHAALPVDHPRRRGARDAHRPDPRGLDARRPAGHLPGSNIALRAPRAGGLRAWRTRRTTIMIQGLVASGMGVALVPARRWRAGLRGRRGPPARGRPPYRRIGVVYSGEAVGPLGDARLPARRRRGL
jgi:DNA-binding transcriptional LysR family regulator